MLLNPIQEHMRGVIIAIKTGIKSGKNIALNDSQMNKRYYDLAKNYKALHGGDLMSNEQVKKALAEGRITLDNL